MVGVGIAKSMGLSRAELVGANNSRHKLEKLKAEREEKELI